MAGVIQLKNGEPVAIFQTIAEAGENLKIDSSSITKVAKGKRSLCGGYGWKYLSEKDSQKLENVRKRKILKREFSKYQLSL